MAKTVFNMALLFVVFSLCPIAFAEPVTEVTTDDAISSEKPSEPKCGYEDMYIYDAVNDRCLINFKKVMKRTIVKYEKNNVQFLPEDEMAKSIYVEGENLFKGIIISVVLFITCASVCVASACIYCCRINLTHTLNFMPNATHVHACGIQFYNDIDGVLTCPQCTVQGSPQEGWIRNPQVGALERQLTVELKQSLGRYRSDNIIREIPSLAPNQDRTLKHNVKALAKKMNRNYNSKTAPKRPPVPVAAQTCSVVVEPAGVFVA